MPSTVVRAETDKTDVDVDAIVKDLQDKVFFCQQQFER